MKKFITEDGTYVTVEGKRATHPIVSHIIIRTTLKEFESILKDAKTYAKNNKNVTCKTGNSICFKHLSRDVTFHFVKKG